MLVYVLVLVYMQGADNFNILFYMQAAEEVNCGIFIHPWDMQLDGRMEKYWLPWLVGMPAETTTAICSLIFGGVLNKFPKLKVMYTMYTFLFTFSVGMLQGLSALLFNYIFCGGLSELYFYCATVLIAVSLVLCKIGYMEVCYMQCNMVICYSKEL